MVILFLLATIAIAVVPPGLQRLPEGAGHRRCPHVTARARAHNAGRGEELLLPRGKGRGSVVRKHMIAVIPASSRAAVNSPRNELAGEAAVGEEKEVPPSSLNSKKLERESFFSKRLSPIL